MPVNLLPIIIPILLGWIVCAGLLFHWRLWAGGSFFGLSLAVLIFISGNTNIEHKIDEEMAYRIVGSGRGAFVEFTTSRGDLVTEGSENVLTVLESQPRTKVHVTMDAWYDFGRMSSYRIVSVDGRIPSYLPRNSEQHKQNKNARPVTPR